MIHYRLKYDPIDLERDNPICDSSYLACKAKVFIGKDHSSRHWQLSAITCEKCKETQAFKEALCEFEIGFDGNADNYQDALRSRI